MLGCQGSALFGRSLRAMADLVFFSKNLDFPCKNSILLLFAGIAPGQSSRHGASRMKNTALNDAFDFGATPPRSASMFI